MFCQTSSFLTFLRISRGCQCAILRVAVDHREHSIRAQVWGLYIHIKKFLLLFCGTSSNQQEFHRSERRSLQRTCFKLLANHRQNRWPSESTSPYLGWETLIRWSRRDLSDVISVFGTYQFSGRSLCPPMEPGICWCQEFFSIFAKAQVLNLVFIQSRTSLSRSKRAVVGGSSSEKFSDILRPRSWKQMPEVHHKSCLPDL